MNNVIQFVLSAVNWVVANKAVLIQIITSIIATASIIVKLTPTLADDNILLPIIKFIGKYLALNVNVTEADRLAANKKK